ncbi:MAG: Mrp/NBP35 family ATP-binding protein [Pseudomonadota bacterium]|nr:Mrp/NBP35 family ATP-binding protein [Pseudomonadota bacterium]
MSKNLEKINVPDSLKKVKNIIGVFSAKGGVGKSAVSLNLALSLQEKGLKVGLADADIYGPSQTILMHASNQQVEVKDQKFLQPVNKSGIKFMSMGLISDDKMPVIWRGPMVSGAVLQLISQTNWQELDYLIVDTPPGTGDVQLTLLQKIPLKGALIITTPEDVSVADTKKGIEMILKLEVPLLGLIENMSWFSPKESNKKYFLFGKDGGKDLSVDYKIDLISQLPLIETEGLNVIYEDKDMRDEFDQISSFVVKKIDDLTEELSKTIPQINLPND